MEKVNERVRKGHILDGIWPFAQCFKIELTAGLMDYADPTPRIIPQKFSG